jgi:hypothetical protein
MIVEINSRHIVVNGWLVDKVAEKVISPLAES